MRSRVYCIVWNFVHKTRMSFKLKRHNCSTKYTFVVKSKRYRSFRPTYDGVKPDDKVKYVSKILRQHFRLNGIVKSEMLSQICFDFLRVYRTKRGTGQNLNSNTIRILELNP